VLTLLVALALALPEGGEGQPKGSEPAADPRAKCFLAAYPGVVCEATARELVLCDGQRIVWDDGRANKPFVDLLESPDLDDTVAQRYRPGREFAVPARNFEPGRWRNDTFLKAMYGDSQKAVEQRTRKVAWMPLHGGKSVRVTTVNGVADALERVVADLERELSPDHLDIVAKTAGVFVWRRVRNSVRQSPHSYAIAIDVGVAWSDYWDWNKPDATGGYRYKNRFPLEIVSIFERHGFIWGGKWYHFDTMHFEYRPELLVAPCVDGASPLLTLGGKDLAR
jgi:hypothetical protein